MYPRSVRNLTLALFVIFGGLHRTIATFADPDNGFGQPDINNLGVVAFPVSLGQEEERIVVSDGNKLIVKATTKGTEFASFMSTYREPRINDRGALAFHADLKSGLQGVFLIDDRGLHKIADTADLFQDLTPPSINNHNQIAYSALLARDRAAVFVGPDPVADRVIGPGDALDGSIVLSAVVSSRSLNDSGQIAFHATLAGGREGIYRADPLAAMATAVPEPTLLGMALLAAAGLMLTRTKRHYG